MSGAPLRILATGLCLMLCMLASSCGGGDAGFGDSGSSSSSGGTTTTGSTPTGSNVADIIVDTGPVNNSTNNLFVTVTVCVPGTTTCQTIDHVQVDTASYGLRILSSVLTVALPQQTLNTSAAVLECTPFVDGFIWGPVVAADVQISGETASSLPIQVIGSTAYTTIPDDCSGTGGTQIDTATELGANGLLGVGPFIQDCGEACAEEATVAAYYACTSTTQCAATAVATTAQVQNPVPSFATDNNGVIVQLPSVAAGGASTVSGYLVFGVDTETNNVSNASGTETVLNVDDNDYLSATINGTTYAQSFIDSGSNGIYFNDSDIPTCTQSGLTDFFCPSATTSLTATLTGANGVTASADFSVANTVSLFSNNSDAAFSDLGGTFPGSTTSVDFGVPFYYGRRVATVIEGDTTTVGTGPYFAF